MLIAEVKINMKSCGGQNKTVAHMGRPWEGPVKASGFAVNQEIPLKTKRTEWTHENQRDKNCPWKKPSLGEIYLTCTLIFKLTYVC